MAMAREAYQIIVAFVKLYREGIHMLWLEVARDGRPDRGSNLLA